MFDYYIRQITVCTNSLCWRHSIDWFICLFIYSFHFIYFSGVFFKKYRLFVHKLINSVVVTIYSHWITVK